MLQKTLFIEAAAMLKIRLASVEDAALIRQLISELAEYEKRSAEVRTTELDIVRDGFGKRPEFRALIADWDSTTAGFVLFFNHYSTWRGTGLYLEDLFVRPDLRGRGIGTALLRGLARTASLEKRTFIRWAVLGWNEPAIRLYEKIGVDFLDEWRTVLLADKSLKQLTSDLPIGCS